MKKILELVVGSLLFLSGCGQASKEPLRIGINAWPGYEFLYLAQEMGYFEAEGVQVKILEFDSLADARSASDQQCGRAGPPVCGHGPESHTGNSESERSNILRTNLDSRGHLPHPKTIDLQLSLEYRCSLGG